MPGMRCTRDQIRSQRAVGESDRPSRREKVNVAIRSVSFLPFLPHGGPLMSTPAPLMPGVSGCRGIARVLLTPDVAARYAVRSPPCSARSSERPDLGRPVRDGGAGCEFLHHAALSRACSPPGSEGPFISAS